MPSSVRCSSWVILAMTRIVAIACGCLVTNLFVVGRQRCAAIARQRTAGSYGARRGLAVGSRSLLRRFMLWHWPSRHLPRLWFRSSLDVSYARMQFALRLGFRPPLAVRSLLPRLLPFPLGGQRAGEARGGALLAPHCGSRWADGARGGGAPGRVGSLRATDRCCSANKKGAALLSDCVLPEGIASDSHSRGTVPNHPRRYTAMLPPFFGFPEQ